MAQPPAYSREKDFTQNFGNETDHAALNAEFDRASNSINDIRTNLALVQADDGKIRASSITTDSLDQEVLDYVQEKALAGANAVADAATAIAREAQQHAASAVQTAFDAVDKSEEAVATAEAAQTQAQQAESKAAQALSETAQIDSKVTAAVDEALHDAIIPGLTPETIAGALGYIPYDAETNNKDFATSAEVAEAISEIPNADWNAESGAEQILNKPELATVATSGSYNDLQDKPTAMTGATAETAGQQGFVPAPEAGDEEKVLTGSGEWKSVSGVPIGVEIMYYGSTPPPGCLVCDGSAVGRTTYPELYAVIGTTYGEGDGETTFNLPNKIGRFGQGSLTPGQYIEAGSPNIKGSLGHLYRDYGLTDGGGQSDTDSALYWENTKSAVTGIGTNTAYGYNPIFDASRSNPIYGNSDTVQPPALTLLPCIKAFDAAVDSGLIDITGLANDLNDKADVDLSNVNAAGKAVIANLGMPSSTAVSLTYTEGGQFTVPADGYLVLRASTSQGGIYIVNISNGIIVSSISEREWALGCVSPVKKGDIVQVSSWQASSHSLFFLYAEGSQP